MMAVRCLRCSALNADGADWCNQCFEPLVPQAPTTPAFGTDAGVEGHGLVVEVEEMRSTTDLAVGEAAPAAAETVRPTQGRWTCPVCEGSNPIASAHCDTCGTSMLAAFTPPEEKVDPDVIRTWSALPGGGHMKAGESAVGLGILLMTAMGLGFGLLLLFGEVTRAVGILILFVAGAVWVGSAYDVQRRLATGADWLFRPRVLSLLAGGIISLVIVAVLMAI